MLCLDSPVPVVIPDEIDPGWAALNQIPSLLNRILEEGGTVVAADISDALGARLDDRP
jgi:hypothetical protein